MLDTVTRKWYITNIAIVAPKIYNKERNMTQEFIRNTIRVLDKIILCSVTVVVTCVVLLVSQWVMAQPPHLVDRQTGKYLGNLSNNQYDQNSTSNPYGRYGSEYSQDSINNPYGQYGSQYSNDSPNNPYATNAPAVVVPCYYGC